MTHFLFEYLTGGHIGKIVDTNEIKMPACWKLWTVSNGYSHTHGIGWSVAHTPVKRLPKKSLASRRQKRTKNRLVKKFPLFAEEFYEEDLKRRPEYFAGERK